MTLEIRTRELIAIGASVAANCHFCVKYHVAKAHENGIHEDEIAEAIEIGKDVQKITQDKMDNLANDLLKRA
jgi:AhpD family alkylhydroperoxidase